VTSFSGSSSPKEILNYVVILQPHQTTQCYIPDNLNLQQHCCEKLKYCTHANGWQNFQWFRTCVSTGQSWNV